MTQIPAANNLMIEMDNLRWRLLLDGQDSPPTDLHVLVEARVGDVLRYQQLFGEKHRLPESGNITPEQIQRVVLGWSGSDAAWHLGVMLTQDIATPRGSRWCELARWAEIEAGQPGGAATRAGESLAYTLQRPFNLVPPRSTNGISPASSPAALESSPPATTRVALGAETTSPSIGLFAGETTPSIPTSSETLRTPHVVEPTRPMTGVIGEESLTDQPAPVVEEKPKRTLPLPQPPFKTGLWTLEYDPNGVLQYRRSASWVWSRLGRAAWYTFWALVYVFLAYATLNSTLALPNAGTMLPSPEILPYLGLASAVLLFVLVLYILIDAILSPGLLVIDPYTQTIRMQRRDQTIWSKNAADVQSVYVSHIVELKHKKRNGQKEPEWHIQHGELNLHLGEKKFKCFLRVEEADEQPIDDFIAYVYGDDGVRPLVVEGVATPMQGAAMTIGQALGVPVYYDHRVK